MKKLLLGLLAIANFTMLQAQSVRKCGNDEVLDVLRSSKPEAYNRIMLNRQAIEQEELTTTPAASKSTGFVQIPVVFHIILTQAQFNRIGGVAGIQQRVDSQIATLNRDYSKTNPDNANVPAVFQPVNGNPEIQFLLAHTKPNGGSTPGWEYKIVSGDTTYDIATGTMGSGVFVSDAKYAGLKGFDAWDYTKYLNIWVVNIAGGQVLGICTPPSYTGTNIGEIPLKERGVVLTYGVFGKRRLMSDYYITGNDRGRTLTHELGHYFELQHIWGSNTFSCSDDDGIGDTPQQYDMNYGCPTPGTVYTNCNATSGGEMWMNYMDYVNDACMYMFSVGQVARQKSQYDNSTKRSWSLTQNAHLGNWPAGIDDVATAVQLSVSPNPTTGVVQVLYNDKNGKLQKVEVTNTIGQQVPAKVLQQSSGLVSLDLSNTPKGLYLIHCTFEQGEAVAKVLLTP